MRQPTVSAPTSNKALEGFPIPLSLQESRASRGTAEDQNPKPAEDPRIMHAWPKRVAIKASASFFDRTVPVCESREGALEQRHAVQHVHGSGARPG